MDFSRLVSRALVGPGLALCCAFVILLASSPAEGCFSELDAAASREKPRSGSDPVTRYWINRSECVSGDVISFPMVIADYAGSELQVWVGEGTGDCTTRDARTTVNATCWRVFRGIPSTNVPTVDIKVQDIAAKKKPPEYDISVGTAQLHHHDHRRTIHHALLHAHRFPR